MLKQKFFTVDYGPQQVLESFLQDFEGKIGLGDADELDETSAMELSYPTALEDSETRGARRRLSGSCGSLLPLGNP